MYAKYNENNKCASTSFTIVFFNKLLCKSAALTNRPHQTYDNYLSRPNLIQPNPAHEEPQFMSNCGAIPPVYLSVEAALKDCGYALRSDGHASCFAFYRIASRSVTSDMPRLSITLTYLLIVANNSKLQGIALFSVFIHAS